MSQSTVVNCKLGLLKRRISGFWALQNICSCSYKCHFASVNFASVQWWAYISIHYRLLKHRREAEIYFNKVSDTKMLDNKDWTVYIPKNCQVLRLYYITISVTDTVLIYMQWCTVKMYFLLIHIFSVWNKSSLNN